MTPSNITTNLRLAGQVRRFHTWPVLREQTIAEHSWHVLRIYRELFGMPDKPICMHILFHDCGEIVTGDLPYPIKKDHPTLKKFIDELEHRALADMDVKLPSLMMHEVSQIQLAHMLEMWEFGFEECVKGNQFAKPIANRCLEAAIASADFLGLSRKVKEYISRTQRLFGVIEQ